MILPPPLTSDCTLDHVEDYLDQRHASKERLMPTGPAGDDDWLSKDDPPPQPQPKPSKGRA